MDLKTKSTTLRSFPLVRQATNQVSGKIRFDPEDHVPLCLWDRCPHYDGKWCRLSGNEPEQICRPACAKLIKALMVLDRTIFGGEA